MGRGCWPYLENFTLGAVGRSERKSKGQEPRVKYQVVCLVLGHGINEQKLIAETASRLCREIGEGASALCGGQAVLEYG